MDIEAACIHFMPDLDGEYLTITYFTIFRHLCTTCAHTRKKPRPVRWSRPLTEQQRQCPMRR